MNIGMLWFDNDPKADLAEKVRRAADYYGKKYNRTASICYVNPAMMPGGVEQTTIGKLQVIARREVLPNHLWIGVKAEQVIGAAG